MIKRTVAIGLVVLMLGLPVAGWADDGQQVAHGVGSAFGTLVYTPVKASFCILGAIGSGFTYMIDSKTAAKVAHGSCGGTWIITPSAVAGKESVRFVGQTEPLGSERKLAAGASERSGAGR